MQNHARSLGRSVALMVVAWSACAGDDAPIDDALAPPPPGHGVQFAMSHRIPPGVEGEWCRFVQAPDDELWVERDEVRFGAGSHHFLLYETAYDTIPTVRDDGSPVDTSAVFDCSDGPTNGWSVTKLLGGSQNGRGDSFLAFPDGVAMRVRPRAVLLMNTHYLNATDAAVEPEVRINLWTRPRAEVTTEGDILFLYNPFIKVAAGGTGRARWRCPVHRDITIANLQSHMHRRGVGYEASVVGGPVLYRNASWDNVPVERFEPGVVVRAGAQLDYHCDYTNPEDRVVFQGARTTDEMCMLIGSYYPADPSIANCLDERGAPAGEWIGNGAATCAATLACLQGAADLAAVTSCVDASAPAVSAPMSAAINCVQLHPDGAGCEAAFAACAGQ